MSAGLSPSTGKIYLITGINGYIATHIALVLLQHGHSIRGTARSVHSTDKLVAEGGVFREYHEAGRVEMVKVEDMTKEGSFQDVVKGVHGILHTASPINFVLLKTWDEFITPAVQGSLSVLQSAFHHAGPQLESFVLTSSLAAISDPEKAASGYSFSESDWNDWTENKCKELGAEAPSQLLYPASKTAAEKAVWGFKNEFKPPFSISAVNPAVVTGAPVNVPATPEGLNETLKPIWNMFTGAMKEVPPKIGSGSYIDVDDVATMHVWCVEHPEEAASQRYMLANGVAPPQAAADVLRKHYPERKEIPVGTPGEGYDPDFGFVEGGPKFNSLKAQKALGRSLKKFDQSVLETAKVLERYL